MKGKSSKIVTRVGDCMVQGALEPAAAGFWG